MYNHKSHNPGRPLAYQTADELATAIEAYFTKCDIENRPYTLSGLGVALGVDRKTVFNYSNKDAFFPTIQAARARIESSLEENLVRVDTKNANGIKFALANNYGWEERAKIDHTNDGGKFGEQTADNLTEAELDVLRKLAQSDGDADHK
jgi:hypothetical protein